MELNQGIIAALRCEVEKHARGRMISPADFDFLTFSPTPPHIDNTNSNNIIEMKSQKANAIKSTLLILLCLIPFIKGIAQNTFDFDKPQGTYIMTDYLSPKITVKLNPGKDAGCLMTKETGTITINGRTLNGTWNRFEDDPYIAFNTCNNVRISSALPSGSAKTDQIIISADGRASYNSSERMKTDGDRISVKKRGTQQKPSATANPNIINLSDFISNGSIDINIRALQNKGFKLSNGEDGATVLKKGGITIEYMEDFDDDGEGIKNVLINFPDMTDAYNFVKPLTTQRNWKMDKASLGEFFTFITEKLTVYREISTVEISNTVN